MLRPGARLLAPPPRVKFGGADQVVLPLPLLIAQAHAELAVAADAVILRLAGRQQPDVVRQGMT